MLDNYSIHNPIINEYCQDNEHNMYKMVLMVVLSIQQQWQVVGDQLADVLSKGLDSKALWGYKANTYSWLQENKSQLYDETMFSIKHIACPEKTLLDIFSKIPNLGLPKAGFCVQLLHGSIGCMDTHNLNRLSIKPSQVKLNKKLLVIKRIEKIDKYINICDNYSSSWLWNSWCEFVADKNKTSWKNSTAVSEAHFTYLDNN